jgi:hypothetical protein
MSGGSDMAAKKDCQLCVMIEEELKDRLSHAAFAADVTGSELVRSCILTALPLLESTPSLVNIIPTLPAKIHRGIVG